MPSWSALKQKGGSQGRGSQGGKAPYAFPPSSSLHLKDFKAPNVLPTAFCSQSPDWRGSFSYTFIKCSFANSSGERPHLAACLTPGGSHLCPLTKKKPPKTCWITQPQSQRLLSSEPPIPSSGLISFTGRRKTCPEFTFRGKQRDIYTR